MRALILAVALAWMDPSLQHQHSHTARLQLRRIQRTATRNDQRAHRPSLSRSPVRKRAHPTRPTVLERRAERAGLPSMHPGRAAVIAGGAMVLDAIVEAGGFPSVVVSETDILDGIVYSLGR